MTRKLRSGDSRVYQPQDPLSCSQIFLLPLLNLCLALGTEERGAVLPDYFGWKKEGVRGTCLQPSVPQQPSDMVWGISGLECQPAAGLLVYFTYSPLLSFKADCLSSTLLFADSQLSS